MREPQQWDRVFFNMAFAIAEKSKDDSTQCGAVIVDWQNRVLAPGYNGPPSQLDDTLVPWNTRPDKYAFIIHAEENALWFAMGSYGPQALIGSKVYVTHDPCTECVLRMIRCGVKTVYVPSCRKPYPMSKYQVEPSKLLDIQTFPKLEIKEVEYVR